MLPQSSPLFWYKLIFITELLICEALFASRLNKRKNFILRLCVSIAAIYAVTVFFPLPKELYNAAYLSFLFLALFGVTFLAMKVCFDASWWNIFFCAIAAYTFKHIAYLLLIAAVKLFSLDQIFTQGGIFDPYGAEGGGSNGFFYAPFALLAYFCIYFSVYWTAYFAFSLRIKKNEDLKLGSRTTVVLAGVIIIANVVFNIITVYNAGGNGVSRALEQLYNLLICMLALYLQFSRLYQKEMKGELETVNRLLYAQKRQYEVSKQTIDNINIKCHDLKHQIHALGGRTLPVESAELAEIEKSIMIYDASVKTGNEALDIILTEKSLYCENNKIKLTCIADGKRLGFMKNSDIYAFFGNAIDNAIEAVGKLDESKRNISFIVKGVGNIVLVHVENYFDGNLKPGSNLPETSKGDKLNHGYGLMSMEMIAGKYGGVMTIDVSDKVFNLNVIFTKQGEG